MAYRVKGHLTKKRREQIGDVVVSYRRLVNDESVPLVARELAECTYYPFVLLAQAVLCADNVAIINKIIASPGKTVKGES